MTPRLRLRHGCPVGFSIHRSPESFDVSDQSAGSQEFSSVFLYFPAYQTGKTLKFSIFLIKTLEMQSFRGSIGLVQRRVINSTSNLHHLSSTTGLSIGNVDAKFAGGAVDAKFVRSPVSPSNCLQFRSLHGFISQTQFAFTRIGSNGDKASPLLLSRGTKESLCHFLGRCMTTKLDSGSDSSSLQDAVPDVPPPRIKFKRLDKTARHIMQIVDREAVQEVKSDREIPEIRPGYTVELKVVVPENKRRLTIIKGIVIARRNAGLNTTIRIRRPVAGVGVESLLPLYSPNIREIKVLDKKKVRRAKLYYLRGKKNPLKRN